MSARTAIVSTLLVALGAGWNWHATRARAAVAPEWREITWPFPLDPWDPGRAFLCQAARCGHDVRIAIRPKIGFCNCTTGVSDDEEIDRMGDLVILGPRYQPEVPGWPVALGTLKGRARRYVFEPVVGRQIHAVSLATSKACDVVVAMIDSDAPIASEVEESAISFLSRGGVAAWAEGLVGRS
jgi:hypothetical protein